MRLNMPQTMIRDVLLCLWVFELPMFYRPYVLKKVGCCFTYFDLPQLILITYPRKS
jgi:hypothetical protein